MGLNQSQRQRQHPGAEPEKVERDSGRKDKKGDRCRGCDFQPIHRESQAWATSPEIWGEEERKRDKEMTGTVRERMRQAETHRQKEHMEDATEHKSLGRKWGPGPVQQRLIPVSSPRRGHQALSGCSEP